LLQKLPSRKMSAGPGKRAYALSLRAVMRRNA